MTGALAFALLVQIEMTPSLPEPPLKIWKVEDFLWLSNKEEGGSTSRKGINSARALLRYV